MNVSTWQAWQRSPGDWLNTPLWIIAQIQALDLAVQTGKYMAAPGADWTKLSATQTALVSWCENE